MSNLTTEALETRLHSGAAQVRSEPGFVSRVLTQIEHEVEPDRGQRSVRRWVLGGSIGVAASLAIAVGVGVLLVSPPKPAFALQDVIRQLHAIRSLHLKGVLFPSTGQPAEPIEIFVQQPDRWRVDGALAILNGKVQSRGTVVYRHDHVTEIDRTNKTASVGTQNPSDVQAKVASMLQQQTQLLCGPEGDGADFRLVRKEVFHGTRTDVYELALSTTSRLRLWFDPANGSLSQTEIFSSEPGKTEQTQSRFDTIEADPILSDAVFEPPVPAGFTKPRAPTTQDQTDVAGGLVLNHTHINLRYSLMLKDGRVLLCWCFYNDASRADDLRLPDQKYTMAVQSQAGVPYTHKLLRADTQTGGWHWRWSVLEPAKKAAGSMLLLKFDFKDAGCTGTMVQFPLTLPQKELRDRVKTLQLQTLSPGAAPLSLEQIEASATR